MRVISNPARRLAALALTGMLLAGCGSETAPADSAPELAEQLTRIDRAVAAGDEARIRQRVEALVTATESARDAGRLDDAQADRILAAADALLARLPAEEPEPEPRPSPSPPSSSATTPTPAPEEGDEDEGDEDEGGDEPGPGNSEGKGKGKGKSDKD